MSRKLADRIMAGLNQALAHSRGEHVHGMVVHVPEKVDVAAIREKTGLSQPAFARTIGVAVGTVRGWEQKRRQPEGPARVLLALLEHNPRVGEETLGRAQRRAAPPTGAITGTRGRHPEGQKRYAD